MKILESLFHLKDNNTDIKTEIRAGCVTFLTMCYIIFVQPGVLAMAGMDSGAVMVATCLSAALATFIMGFYANYPIAQAPLMGENFFFTFTIVVGMKLSWNVALGAVFISGVIFLLLNFFRIREMLIDAVPESLKDAIAAGIGIFIAFIGMQTGGLVVSAPGTMVKLGNIWENPAAQLTLLGILTIAVLMSLRIKGAIIIGIILTTVIGIFMKVVDTSVLSGGFISAPPTLEPTWLKLDIKSALTPQAIPIIAILLFMLVFDTIGTIIGVSNQAGLLKNGKLPRANRALLSDAVGTVAGSLLGTSTVSSYIESASGVSEGGRTGLSNIITGLLFIAAIFFSPIVKLVGGGYHTATGAFLYPVTAPVLIIVGSLMAMNIAKIKWNEPTESIPAFLTIVGMPFCYNIADGLAFGFISYPIIKLFSGRAKDVSWLIYLMAVLLILRYVLIKL